MKKNDINIYVYYAYKEFENELPISKEFENDNKIFLGKDIPLIIVREEDKKYFEDKYNLPLTDFKTWYEERAIEYGYIEEKCFEISEEESEISKLIKLYFDNKAYTENFNRLLIKLMLRRLHNQNEEQIIDILINNKYDAMLYNIVKDKMINDTIDYLKDGIKILKEESKSLEV